MARSRLDQVVEGYAEHEHMYNPATVTSDDKEFVLSALKNAVLSDVRDKQVRQMKEEAKAEAKAYKKSLFKKVQTNVIIETILVALLVGIVVNQVTNLLPSDAPWPIIIVSLLLCILLIWLETGKK